MAPIACGRSLPVLERDHDLVIVVGIPCSTTVRSVNLSLICGDLSDRSFRSRDWPG